MCWEAGNSECACFVPVVVFVTPLAPRPADCRVVAALRLCEASRAGVRIIIPRACQALCTSFICLTSDEVISVGKKMVLPAAIRGKSQW